MPPKRRKRTNESNDDDVQREQVKYDGTAAWRDAKKNHQREGRCKYRPNDFMEHLELSPFKAKYPESNFVARLDALSTASSKWNSFTEVEWSTSLWQEHGKYDDTPFIVRNYPDIWKDGKCPTEGQFIKCSYQIDAHSDGLIYLTDSTHLADLGPGHTPECLSHMGEVMERYIDSSNPSSLGDPDNLRYAVGMSFVGDLDKYAFLNIPDADEADFCIQPAGVFADLHVDVKNSLAWLRGSRGEPRKGKKAWVAFPKTPTNEKIWYDMHGTSHDYLNLTRTASEKMGDGQYCIQNTEDLVFIPVGWFHAVVTLEPSILVGSWLNGNGYEMLCSLYVYMRTSRIRHGGKNEKGFKGWTDKERTHLETGMSILLAEIKPLIETKAVSQDRAAQTFEKIWAFADFNEEDTGEETKVRVKWFLEVVWSADWRDITTELKMMYGEERDGLWANSCFISQCEYRRSDGRNRSHKIKDIMTHMKRKHL